MRTPTEAELSGASRRLVATVVMGDPNVNRREDQLRELIHILFVKLESDAIARRSKNQARPVSFRIYGDRLTKQALTAQAIRKHFSDYFHRQRTRIYLLWALTLKVVRSQWKRVVFMQTNCEDVEKRYLEIEIPMPPSAEEARQVSEVFRRYYLSIAEAITHLREYLVDSNAHHFSCLARKR